MSDTKIKVFYSVATHLNFTKASEELFLSQPAVSKNIKELEIEYGTRLFDRKGNRIELTQSGNILFDYAEQILSIYKKIDFDLNIIKQKFSGNLSLGTSTTIGQYLLPVVLAHFSKNFPDIQISLLNANTQKIEKSIIDKKIELGIVEGKSKNKQIKYLPFIKDEIVAIAHTSQKISQYDEINLEELKKLPIVLRETGSGTLEVIKFELAKHHIQLKDLNIKMFLGNTESIKSFLAHSNSLGFVSVASVSKEISKGEFKVLEIQNFNISRTFNFIYLQGVLGGNAKLFMDFTKKHYNLK